MTSLSRFPLSGPARALGAICLCLLPLAASGQIRVDQLSKNIGDLPRMREIDPSIMDYLNTDLPEAVRGQGCNFYEHADRRGKRWHKSVAWLAQSSATQDGYAEYVAYVGDWWNDRISSLSCNDSAKVHCSVAVYTDANKGGNEAIFWGSQGTVNLAASGFEDKISSFVVYCVHMK